MSSKNNLIIPFLIAKSDSQLRQPTIKPQSNAPCLRHFGLHLFFSWRERLDVPNRLRIFINATVAREEAHASYARYGLGDPLLLVAEALVDELLCLAVGSKVIRHEIIVAMLDDSIHKGGEGAGVAKCSLFNGLEHFGQRLVQLILAVDVTMAQLFNIFRKIAKQKNVVFANLARNLNLWGW